jgi:outer membrane protein OmpA-like peptidoglycan-associated protein
MALTASDLSEMAISFGSLFGGFVKKISPPEVPEVWTSLASVITACTFLSVKLVIGESSASAVVRFLYPAVYFMLVFTIIMCVFYVLTRSLVTYTYDSQVRIGGTRFSADARTFRTNHSRALKDILDNFGGEADRVWTPESVNNSRRLLGIAYALCVASLAFTINLGIEAYNAPKDSPKFADVVSKLADVHFDLDKTDLGQDAADKIASDAGIILSAVKQFPKASFLLEGFCDDRGSEQHNLALGYKRAEVTRDALIHAGVAATILQVTTQGRNSPLCTEDTERCRQQNRRVHVIGFE